ncbi:MAG TPA: glycosyltransferase [Agriterribacter sp.]|nr:glycosyltransferase [Agriterribacter sp.]
MPSPKILVAPLDWGLGHASRCVPLVNELIHQGCEVCLAGEGKSMLLLKREFPQLRVLPLTGYDIFYHNTTGYFGWVMSRQVPAIIRSIRREHKWLKKLMEEEHFDAIVSDNRYGLYAEKVHSVFITHQLAIRTGLGYLMNKCVQKINYKYINKFNECWVPDFKGEDNLAGKLSHPPVLPANTTYIGPISRFKRNQVNKKYDLLILLSGPEPRRTIWEEALLKELNTYKGKALLVRGIPGCNEKPLINNNAGFVNFADAGELNVLMQQAEWVVCRSGYTSIMDLVQLQHKAILVPTPGQPEQEYLAKYLHQKGMFYAVTEAAFALGKSLQDAEKFPFSFINSDVFKTSYKTQVTSLIKRIMKKNLAGQTSE